MTRRRIQIVELFMGCQYSIQIQKRFLFWKYWKRTHLCKDFVEAMIVFNHLEAKERNIGKVVYCT